jgi:hypothetical protein
MRSREDTMETHVKVLGILEIAMGAMSLLGALALSAVFLGGFSAAAMSGDADARVAMPFIGLTGAALVTFLLILSLPGIVTGIGLLRFRPWARIAGIVISILGLMAFPFGTIIGVYGIWVLFSKDTERLFVPV